MSIVNMAPTPENRVELTAEQRKRRRARSIAIGLALGGLALLFYVVTFIKLGATD